MIKVSKQQWNSINNDYKGVWEDYYDEHPEWIGKRVVMSTCVTENPEELGYLMIEGVHFIIEE